MKNSLFILLILFLFYSCLTPKEFKTLKSIDTPKDIYIIEGLSETVSLITEEDLNYYKGVAFTEKAPNDIKGYGDYIYIVNSLSNSITIYYEKDMQEVDKIELPENSNPWEMLIYTAKQYILVSNFLKNSVYIIDLYSKEIIKEITTEQSPEGILLYKDLLFVACTGYKNGDFGDGYISIIDLNSLSNIKNLLLPCKNPQSLFKYSNYIYAICTGYQGTDDGYLIKIDPNALDITNTIFTGGSPGEHEIIGTDVALTGVGGNVVFFNLETNTIDKTINVESDPTLFISGLLYDKYKNILFISSFNKDRIYIYNINSDNIEKTIETLDGPQMYFFSDR